MRFGAAAALLLCACASQPPAPASKHPVMPLLAPSTLGSTRTAQQQLRASYGEQDATLTAVLQVTPQRLRVIGLNAVGLRLFTLEYDGTNLVAEAVPGLPEQIEPRRILADLQFAMWPLAALKGATVGGPWEVSEPEERLRELKLGGKLVAEVRYLDRNPWDGRLQLTNHAFGYTLAVESRPLDTR